MNMKKIYTILAVAAFMFCGCMETELPNDYQDGAKVFTASFEEPADTKTYVDENLKLLWNADDRLSIFTTTYNQQYKFTGSTGDNSGDFEEVTSGGFHSGNSISTNYAVYPYSSSTNLTDDEYISLTLPAVQSYAEGTFGLGANTMVAVTSSPSDTFLPFKNLCGYLVVKLYGEGTVKSISLKGNNGEKLAGPATVTATYGSAPMLKMDADATGTITVECGEGVKLGADADNATEFWFCIPPVTFSKGFTVTVTDTDDLEMEKSTTASKRVTRNVRTSMTPLEVMFEPAILEYVDLGLSVKWATCNLGASSPEEYGDYYAWGETETKTNYTWSTYFDSVDGSDSNFAKYYLGGGPEFLDSEDDAAHVKLGGKWRMPTALEINELITNCQCEWVTYKGINGRKFTSKKEGYTDKWIFLPAAGYREGTSRGDAGFLGCYWSSSLGSGVSYNGWDLFFYSDFIDGNNFPRYYGQSVRPVCE